MPCPSVCVWFCANGCSYFQGPSLALRSHDQFQAFHWSSLLPHYFFFGSHSPHFFHLPQPFFFFFFFLTPSLLKFFLGQKKNGRNQFLDYIKKFLTAKENKLRYGSNSSKISRLCSIIKVNYFIAQCAACKGQHLML